MLLVPGTGLSRKGRKSPSLSQRRKPKPRQVKHLTPNHKVHNQLSSQSHCHLQWQHPLCPPTTCSGRMTFFSGSGQKTLP